jgi:hypothetical protein
VPGLARLASGDDQVGTLQDLEVFPHRLPRHEDVPSQFAGSLAVLLLEARQQRAPRGIGQGEERAVEHL